MTPLSNLGETNSRAQVDLHRRSVIFDVVLEKTGYHPGKDPVRILVTEVGPPKAMKLASDDSQGPND